MRKNFIHVCKNRFIEFFIILVLCSGMSVAKDQGRDNVLATVGKKNITVTEFKARCEFTVRPENLRDKSIALNNLIFEKILALEAENNNSLESNPIFQARLKGIKEQQMREKLRDQVAVNKASVDTSALINAYRLSIREYELEFYRMHKPLVDKVKSLIDTGSGDIDLLFKGLSEYAGKQPVHKVKYTDSDYDTIHEALYSKPLQIGQVIGPIEIDPNDFLVMKVVNWTAYPLLSDIDQRERWNEVKEKERSIKAEKIWEAYYAGVMHGKKIEFDTKTFLMLANWMRERYIVEQKEKVPSTNPISEIPFSARELDLTKPFFTFEDKVWTIGDFRNELMSRPFLIRTQDMDSANFYALFKTAVVDVMKDHCLTREAYKLHLDTLEDIKRTVGMWKDSFVANNEQKNIIDAALSKGNVMKGDDLGILKFWESYVNALQNKYKDSVVVNIPAFKSISLTKINMVALKLGMPYQLMVPDFPKFISSGTFDYKKQME